MATAVINGRRVQVPPVAKVEEIRQAGGIADGRVLMRRTRDGNIVMGPGTEVSVQDGDVFTDAPPRIKG